MKWQTERRINIEVFGVKGLMWILESMNKQSESWKFLLKKSIRNLVFQWISVNKTNHAISWIVLSFFRMTLAWFSLRHLHNGSENAHSISRTKGTVLVFILMSSESTATCCKHKPRDLEFRISMSESPPFCFTVWRRYRAEDDAIIHSAHIYDVHMCLWCRSENQALSFIDLQCSLRKNYPLELKLLEHVMVSLLNWTRNFNGSNGQIHPQKRYSCMVQTIHVRCKRCTVLTIPTLS